MSTVAITDQNSLATALAQSQNFPIIKNGSAPKSSGTYNSFWKSSGFPPAAPVPGSIAGAIPDNLTLGALPFTPSSFMYLGGCVPASSQPATLLIYDRLWHNSGLNSNITTVQTINGATINRYLSQPGNQLFLEVHANTGTTLSTVSVSYTNESGVSGRVATCSLPSSSANNNFFVFTLQSGDTSVRSVQSFTMGTATGTVGDLGLVILRPIAYIGIPFTNISVNKGIFDLPMTQILPNSCIAFAHLASNTTSLNLSGSISVL